MVRRKHKFGSPYLSNQPNQPTNQRTNQPTDMEKSPCWETNGCSASQKAPALYGTRRISTAFKPARHPSLFWASLIQFMPPIPLLEIHFNIILSSTPGSPKWSLSLRFPHHNRARTTPLPHTSYVPRQSHTSWSLKHIWWVQVIKLLVM